MSSTPANKKQPESLPPLEYVAPSRATHADFATQLKEQRDRPAKIELDSAELKKKMASGFIEEPTFSKQQFDDYYAELNEKKSKKTERMLSLAKYNPFVPLGCLLTIGVLFRGLWAMRSNDRAKSQQMMRYRVAAQGSTVVALVIGTFVSQYFFDTDSNAGGSKSQEK